MEKYWALALAVFFVAMFTPLAVEEYQKGQCKTEAIKAGKSAADISIICR